ncbi:MAG: hypothetical protein ABIS50_19960 [Luteolibacter sp.]|uniref:hypothetical protein n=1 Tax=Luteolibacter sp. TaxID=1962973 RepID=UPI003267C29C
MGEASTDFLTARSSFITGAGSAFAIAGNYFDFNRSQTPDLADARALRSDWRIIGQDMDRAIVLETIRTLACDEAHE